MEKREKNIELWSSYPPPFGGVSIHSLRLFCTLKQKYNIVFKNFNGTYHSPENGIIKVQSQFMEILSYCFKRNRIIHLHSNRLLVWLIVLFYARSNKIILTLHNHNLKKNLPFYKDLLLKVFFRKVKFVFLNNQKFADYLIDKYRLNKDKVIVIPAFIAPLPEESEELPKEITSFMNKFDKIISSFAWKLYRVAGKDVYGIDHIVEAFALLKYKYQSVGLVLIIPIIEDEAHYQIILGKIEKYQLRDSILIYTKPIRNGFDVWKKSDLFLRSTNTDIEGISIKEALYYNTPVIATDVVERPVGVSLYSYGDIKKLSMLMKENLQQEKNNVLNNNIPDGITEIDKIYNSLFI